MQCEIASGISATGMLTSETEVALLLEAAADPGQEDGFGMTARATAVEMGHADVVSRLDFCTLPNSGRC